MNNQNKNNTQNTTMYLCVAILVLVMIIVVYNVIIKQNTETIKQKLAMAQKTLELFNPSDFIA